MDKQQQNEILQKLDELAILCKRHNALALQSIAVSMSGSVYYPEHQLLICAAVADVVKNKIIPGMISHKAQQN